MPSDPTSPAAEAYFKVTDDITDTLTFYRQLDNGYEAKTVVDDRGVILKVDPEEEFTLQAREYSYFFVFNMFKGQVSVLRVALRTRASPAFGRGGGPFRV